MIAITGAAVLLTGLRAMPPVESWRAGYLLWRGMRQHRSEVTVTRARSGTDSAAYQRAILNRQMAEMQFAMFVREAFPDPIGSVCVGAVCLSAVGGALALPAWCVRVIRRGLHSDSQTRPRSRDSCHDQ
jgi:hypothetical protein